MIPLLIVTTQVLARGTGFLARQAGIVAAQGLRLLAKGTYRAGSVTTRHAPGVFRAGRTSIQSIPGVVGGIGEAIEASRDGLVGFGLRRLQPGYGRLNSAEMNAFADVMVADSSMRTGALLHSPDDPDAINEALKDVLIKAKPELERELRTATFRAAHRIRSLNLGGSSGQMSDHVQIRSIFEEELRLAGQAAQARLG